MSPPIQPPRPRLQSGGDVPIPEAVFVALHNLHEGQRELTQEMRAGFAMQAVANAAQTETNAKLEKLAKDASAMSIERWTNLAKALVPAIALIVGGTVGGQKLLEGKPQPPEVRAVRSSEDLALDECRPLQPGSYERAECFERVSRGPSRRGMR